MSFADDLLDSAVTGDLQDEQIRHLEEALARDPALRGAFAGDLETEALLRSLDENFDVSTRVMRQLHRELAIPQKAPGAPAVAAPQRWRVGRAWVWAGALAALMMMTAGLGLWKSGGPERVAAGELWALQGAVRVTGAAGSFTADKNPRAIFAGDHLTLAAEARAQVLGPDGSRLELLGPADFRLAAPGEAMSLRSGWLKADIRPQPVPMRFATPFAQVTVLGTRFTLGADEQSSRIRVEEGRVKWESVAGAQQAVELAAGQWSVARAEGLEHAAEPRRRDGLQVLYLFDEGQGMVVRDQSGHPEPLHLALHGDRSRLPEWLSGGGLKLDHPGVAATADVPRRLLTALQASQALTVEAWVTPREAFQNGPARIVTLSDQSHHTNLLLGQGSIDMSERADWYVARLRTTRTNPAGLPGLESPQGSVQTRLTHLVFTHDAQSIQTLYIDGHPIRRERLRGDFSNWESQVYLAIGDEVRGGRPWLGVYHLVAIYDRALSEQEVSEHFAAGPWRREEPLWP